MWWPTHSVTFTRTCTHSTHACMHTHTHALSTPSVTHPRSTHLLTHALTHFLTLTHLLTHLLTHSLTLFLTHSLTHSLTHPLTRSLTHSLTSSLTHSLTHTHSLAHQAHTCRCQLEFIISCSDQNKFSKHYIILLFMYVWPANELVFCLVLWGGFHQCSNGGEQDRQTKSESSGGIRSPGMIGYLLVPERLWVLNPVVFFSWGQNLQALIGRGTISVTSRPDAN